MDTLRLIELCGVFDSTNIGGNGARFNISLTSNTVRLNRSNKCDASIWGKTVACADIENLGGHDTATSLVNSSPFRQSGSWPLMETKIELKIAHW